LEKKNYLFLLSRARDQKTIFGGGRGDYSLVLHENGKPTEQHNASVVD
jgi:hypothetical protein